MHPHLQHMVSSSSSCVFNNEEEDVVICDRCTPEERIKEDIYIQNIFSLLKITSMKTCDII